MTARFLQINLIVSFALFSWLAMQAVHEFGHVGGAWLTGGTVEKVIVYPTVISRTDWKDSRNPLVVVWAGPIVGSALPVALWGIAAAFRLTATYLARFFAGFCLIANGAYIGADRLIVSATPVNCCDMALRFGSFGSSALWPSPQVCCFGIDSVRTSDSARPMAESAGGRRSVPSSLW